MKPELGPLHRPSRSRQRLPRSFGELTPTRAFNPRTFFYEMVWKALLTHAHFDHFHKPTLRRLPRPKIALMPWGMSDLAHDLGFERVIELEWWESFSRANWTVTLTPCRHWGARMLRDDHRGYGGFV